MIGFYDYTVILTYFSLLSATTGIVVALSGSGHPYYGCLFLLFCGLCDAFDGKVARTKKGRTKMEMDFGIQIDSLSDLVAFGVLPACIGAALIRVSPYLTRVLDGVPVRWEIASGKFILHAFLVLYVLAAMIRLAYYNVTEEERQETESGARKEYLGLPVTSAALIFPFVLLLQYMTKADITLPGRQREMLTKLMASGKPVVTVFMNGRPLAMGWEAEHLPVMVEAWHLGIQMGNAVASVLFGDKAPSGKLSSSFPYVNGQCPIYYNHPSTGRPAGKSKFTSKYLDAPAEALFPFGYGLSYTTFAYDGLRVEEKEDHLEICVKVANAGERAGVEVAQLYMQDVAASLVRPVRELKGYKRVELAPGEEKEVSFVLDKKDMGFYDNTGKYRLEDGLFRIFAGTNSVDALAAEITVRF